MTKKRYEAPTIIGVPREGAIKCIIALNIQATAHYMNGDMPAGDEVARYADLLAEKAQYYSQRLKTRRLLARRGTNVPDLRPLPKDVIGHPIKGK